MARFLVTGGAGFVGSHLVAALLGRGDQVVVLDNLRTGHRAAVLPGAAFVLGDLADAALLDRVLAAGPWDAVFHFAALSQIGESMRDPLLYLEQNAGLGIALLRACIRHGVRQVVASSTASVFGEPVSLPIDETAALMPTSAYGESKLMLERALYWASRAHGLRCAVLRYFNAAGADPEGRLGEHHEPETHLIPLAIDAALGRRPPLTLFGTDYPTRDGTCIRDYVHVADLAAAHLVALERLRHGSVTFNIGNGAGHSVREVIGAVERVLGRAVPFDPAPRRAGDPAVLVASAERLRSETGWTPRFPALDAIVGHAAAWRLARPSGYA